MGLKKSNDEGIKIFSVLNEMVRKASLKSFIGYTGWEETVLQECPLAGKTVLGFWVSSILLNGTPLKIVIKVHFMAREIKFFASRILRESPENISYWDYSDFAKEYCNQAAGSIKQKLGENGIPMGISLPLMGRGFDELFGHEISGPTVHRDVWRFSCQDHFLDCTSHIELLSLEKLADLKFKDGPEGGKTGEVILW